MKKNCMVLLCALMTMGLGGRLHAQSTDSIMPIEFGNFENWIEYPSDTVVMVVPIPLYDAYTLPEGWHAPMFVVDDTIAYGTFTLPVHLSLPVCKVSRDTVHAPQGRSALVAESFLLGDVLSEVASTIALNVLDSSLTTEVLPSIVTNAEVDLMKILPLMERAADNQSDLSWLLEMADTMDLNELIKGGAPLNGFEFNKLRGMYKYQDANGDADIDDNATLVALGTYYDRDLGKRMLVGAGSKNLFQMYDTVNYEQFTMDYYTLNEYYPAEYAFVEADSMVVIAISSTNEKNRARGSKLFLDSLTMVQRDGSCGRITNVWLDDWSTVHAVIKWSSNVVPDRWTVTYGPAGFDRGRAPHYTVRDSVTALMNLEPNTTYDFYVRSECGDTSTSTWAYLQFTTDSLTHHSINDVLAEAVTLSPNPAQGYCEVDFGGLSVSRVTLYDVTGKVEDTRKVSGNSVKVTLPRSGIYIVALQTPQGIVYKKVVNK